MKLIEGGSKGLFHVTSSSCLTKYKFGCQIADHFGFDRKLIQPASVDEINFLGARSHKLNLNNAKLINELGLKKEELSTGLNRFFRLYQQGYPQFMQSLFETNV